MLGLSRNLFLLIFVYIFTFFPNLQQKTKNPILLIYKNIIVKIWSSVVVFGRKTFFSLFSLFVCLFLLSHCGFVLRPFDFRHRWPRLRLHTIDLLRLRFCEETIDQDRKKTQKRKRKSQLFLLQLPVPMCTTAGDLKQSRNVRFKLWYEFLYFMLVFLSLKLTLTAL